MNIICRGAFCSGLRLAISLLKKYKNLIITRTFSKAYGLAGVRLGYGISSPLLIREMNRIRLSFNLNAFAIEAGMAAIQDSAHLKLTVKHNKDEMMKLRKTLDEMSISYIPSATNFLSLDLGRPAKPIYTALLKRGIITRLLENYGMPHFLGVTIGLASENEAFLKALAEVMSAECKKIRPKS